jgi:hypothetical protein
VRTASIFTANHLNDNSIQNNDSEGHIHLHKLALDSC